MKTLISFVLCLLSFGLNAATISWGQLATTNVMHTADFIPIVAPAGVGQTNMTVTLGVLATSLSRDQGMITNNYSPTFNNITGTNLSMYGSAGGTIKLYDASGNGPYAQLGTNDNLALSNSATAMTVTLTNGGANFDSNVVAKHFYGDGSTLTGVGGGSGTVSNTAALTSGQFVIGGGNGAVSTTAYPPLISPNGFLLTGRQGSRVLLSEDIYNGTVATIPINLIGAQGTSSTSAGISDIDSNHLGLVQMTIATNAATYSEFSGRAGGVVLGNGDWYVEYSMRFTNADATMSLSNGWVKVGWVSGRIDIASQTDGCWAQLLNSTNTWAFVTSSNTVRTTNITSTVGWTTNWQTIGIYSPYPNTNAMLYVNGSAVATNNSNIPLGVARASQVRIGAGASAAGLGSSTLGIYLDYIWQAISPNSWP